MLHMLRQEVGTEHFWTAIREYYRRYRNGNASTADLRAVFEQVSGKPLDWFFTQWLNRPGVPKLEGSWRYDAARKQVEVTLSQAQAGEPFRVNVDVGIVATAGALPGRSPRRMTGAARHVGRSTSPPSPCRSRSIRTRRCCSMPAPSIAIARGQR